MGRVGRGPEADFAASLLVQNLSSSESIRLCERLDVGTSYKFSWRAALDELSRHDREVVVPYLLKVVREGTSTERWICYGVCTRAAWPDLLGYAALDQDNQDSLDVYQSTRLESVGSASRGYLETFPEGRRLLHPEPSVAEPAKD